MLRETAISTKDWLLRGLSSQNPWWTLGKVPQKLVMPYRRRDFYTLKERMPERKILAIVGPRRAGKTTVLFQLVDDLIREQGVDPKRILFVSLDYPYLQKFLARPFLDILTAYEEAALRGSVEDSSDRVYIFLDEVYALAEWGATLKGHFDRSTNTKLVVSGSSSPEIMHDAAKALVGRLDRYVMMQMKFSDVAEYGAAEGSGERVDQVSREILREGVRKALEEKDPKALLGAFREGQMSLSDMESELQARLMDYLLKDGYPENLDQDDLNIAARNISQAVELALLKDVMKMPDMREPGKAQDLLGLIAQRSGSVSTPQSIAKALRIDYRTVEKYLAHLESAYLISSSYRYSGSLYRSMAGRRKLYISNSGVRNAVLGILDERLLGDPAQLGICAETAALDHIRRLGYCLQPTIEPRTYYWRQAEKHEVDIVANLMGRLVPIDVRFRESIDQGDLSALNRFMDERNKCPFGILLTKRHLGMEGRIVMLPLWLFLLAC